MFLAFGVLAMIDRWAQERAELVQRVGEAEASAAALREAADQSTASLASDLDASRRTLGEVTAARDDAVAEIAR